MYTLATFNKITEDNIDPHVEDILNISKFDNDSGILINDVLSNTSIEESSSKKKKKSKQKVFNEDSSVVLADDNEELQTIETNKPYLDSYTETNNMLRSSILQIDTMQDELTNEINKIKGSNTIRKKYDYITMMMGTSSNLIGTKVTAIREMNKTITDCHNLELKRTKDLKLTENKTDDDKYIMDMYNAFISTPTGTYSQLGPSPMDINNSMMQSNMITGSAQYSYEDYMNNLTPAQRMMNYEQDPNIKECVIYDEMTGNIHFQVINKTTGQPVPDMETPDKLFLQDIIIDKSRGIAKNKNLDITYDLIIVNGNTPIMEY